MLLFLQFKRQFNHLKRSASRSLQGSWLLALLEESESAFAAERFGTSTCFHHCFHQLGPALSKVTSRKPRMFCYQLICIALLSGVLVVTSQKPPCYDCDLSRMYKDWIPCRVTGGCKKSGRFTVMVKGDDKRLCPLGCRCYTKESKQVTDKPGALATTEKQKLVTTKPGVLATTVKQKLVTTKPKVLATTVKQKLVTTKSGMLATTVKQKLVTTKPGILPTTVERKPETSTEQEHLTEVKSRSPVQFQSHPLTLSEKLAQLTLCDIFNETQSPGYLAIYNQDPFCISLGNRTIYATIARRGKSLPYFECRILPLNGKIYTVSSDADKTEVLDIMRKWGIDRAWVSLSDEVNPVPKPAACLPSKKCVWNYRCGECCLALDSTSKSGTWLQVPCDEQLEFICVFDVNEKSLWW